MHLFRLIVLLNTTFWQIALASSGDPKPLVNLGMLNGTKISASSVNGAREVDDQYYGAFNLFDGGENRINKLNYTTWLTDNESRHWVKLQFEAPVEVDSIMLELPGREPFSFANPTPSPTPLAPAAACVANTVTRPRPAEFAVDVTTQKNGTTFVRKMPSIEATGFRLYYPLEKPVQNVTDVTIVFPGPSTLEVSELEVMGIPSKPVAYRPKRNIPSQSK